MDTQPLQRTILKSGKKIQENYRTLSKNNQERTEQIWGIFGTFFKRFFKSLHWTINETHV